MASRRDSELTDGQKECLRLVNHQLTSKEIARELGISRFTVDQRLDAARRKLKAPSRKEAARIFANMEDQKIYEQLVYDPRYFDDPVGADMHREPTDQVEQLVYDERELEYLIGQIYPAPNNRDSKKLTSSLAVPPLGGSRHQLSTKKIIVGFLNIAFYTTFIAALLVAVISRSAQLCNI